MRARLVLGALLAALLIASTPATAATLEWEQIVRIDPGEDVQYNQTFNASADNATTWTNYNQTIIPFMNETGVNGTFTGTWLPPVVYNVTDDATWGGHWGSVCRFKSDWVMSGSSVSWWRVPALNVTGWSTFYFRIWRLEYPGLLDVAYGASGPNEGARPFKVWEVWLSAGAENETWYQQENVTAWNQTWNFTWLKVEAPIHADTAYYAQWSITGGSSGYMGEKLLMAETDVGDDGLYSTWWDDGSGTDVIECDLDISVVHQYGMGYTVAGYEVKYDSGGGGGGPAYMPSNQDDMTDALSPTGTGDGGAWDGDWAGTGISVQVHSGRKVAGTYSLYSGTLISTNDRADYTLDSPYDISGEDTFTFWYYPGTSNVLNIRLYLLNSGYPGTGGGVWKNLGPYTVSTWNEIEVDLNDWVADGWTAYGSFDEATWDIWRIIWYTGATGTDWANWDMAYFTSGGGGGGSNPSIEFYSNITDGPDEVGDYVTFFMPLMYDVNSSAAATVHISEVSSGFTWDFVVDITQDFILNSTTWGYATEGNQFLVNVTFQNASNTIFIHDHNPDNVPSYDDSLSSHKNRFKVYNAANLSNGHIVHFRPYHALQVTNGSWVNTQVDPVYYLDGRVVNITDYKLRDTDHSDPLWVLVLRANVWVWKAVYTVTDKVLFNDLLPDWDEVAQFFLYDLPSQLGLRVGTGLILFSVVHFMSDVYEWVLKYGPAILHFIMKILEFIIAVPVFMVAVLVVNSVKRFFVVFAADGPEVGMQYGAHLVRNAFKRLPLPDIDRSVHVEKAGLKRERQWARRQARMRAVAAAKARHGTSRNYTRLNLQEGEKMESQEDLKREYEWQQRRKRIQRYGGNT